uniref:Uncharacterized protein n=1 Tax=Hordeum vulgare subsp. vulgare TaxID=112509 RepID=A0A8I6WJP6_HORVV
MLESTIGIFIHIKTSSRINSKCCISMIFLCYRTVLSTRAHLQDVCNIIKSRKIREPMLVLINIVKSASGLMATIECRHAQ